MSKLSCITSQNLVRALCGHKSAQDFFQDREFRLKLYLNNRHHVCMTHTVMCVLTRARGLMFSGYEDSIAIFARYTRLTLSSSCGLALRAESFFQPLGWSCTTETGNRRLLLSRKPATPAYVRLCQGENRDKRRQVAMQLRGTGARTRCASIVFAMCSIIIGRLIGPSLRRISSSAQRLGNA